MTEQLGIALAISCLALVGLLVWALSIALVQRDASRRDLPSHEQVAWLALAALVPIIGGAAYFFARMLEGFFSPAAEQKPGSRKRITALKPLTPAKRLSTIAAADTFRQTVAKAGPAGHARWMRDRHTGLSLEVLSGPLSGRKYILKKLPASIGRGPQVALSLDADEGVSRQHAEIYESAGSWRIRDLNSTHGTFLNENRITDDVLNSGDRLLVGSSVLVFVVEGQHDAA